MNLDRVEQLPPDKRKMVEVVSREMIRRSSNESLYSFLRAAWRVIEPRRAFVPGFHIGAICEHLQAVKEGQINSLLINIPPRHAKSTIVSVAFPAWDWKESPEDRFLFGSHSFSLSKRDSVKCRNLIQSDWYRDTFGIAWGLASDQNEKMRFDNTAGGTRMATSVGASIIGQGGDYLILDDPHSPRSVRSDVQRKDELDWIDDDFFTRVNDPTTVSKIVIMQRLDQRDASAHLLAQGGWEHLMLPAEFEEKRKCTTSVGWEDPRKKEGEPLWPERFDKAGLEKTLKKTMSPMKWAGQGQQRPAPAEGNLVKREWWQFYRTLPEDIELYVQSWDLTFKETEKGSFVVGQVWAKKGPDKYLVHQYRERIGFTDQVDAFRKTSDDYPQARAKYVEEKANGSALIETLDKEISGIIPINPGTSKENRAEAITPEIRSGHVHLPHPDICSWTNDYIEEWATFPNGLNDDQVDATSQALKELSSGPTYDIDTKSMSMTAPSKWL